MMWAMDVLHSALKGIFVVGTSSRVMLMSLALSVGCFLINNDTCCLWVVIWLALGLATKAFKTSSYNTSRGRGDGCGMDGIEIHRQGCCLCCPPYQLCISVPQVVLGLT